MATVVLTIENKNNILNMARALFDKQIAEAKTELPSSWGDICYDRIIGTPHGAQIASVPAAFFPLYSRIQVRVLGLDSGVEGSFTFDLSTSKPFPYALPTNSLVKVEGTGYSNGFKLVDVDEWVDLRQAITDRHNRIVAATGARNQFTHGVAKVLEAHKTLAPALRAWPPLWDLLPNHLKEKHKEIKERAKPDAPVIGVNLDDLTGIVVRSKILKGE